jgi:predicted CopG family antitoxin
MATKTISVDLEAYDRLCSIRRENESFSQAIKRAVKPPFDVKAYLKGVEERPMSDATAEAVEEQVRRRHQPSRRERS